MTPESNRASESTSGGELDQGGEAQQYPRPTRRGVLLGVSLAGLGGTLAGCSTAAVPYDANEAGVVNANGGPAQAAMPSSGAMSSSGAMPSSGCRVRVRPAQRRAAARSASKAKKDAKVTGMVLGAASEIPVGGGKNYTAAKVVATQPARGQYRAFSAGWTHVGCIMSEAANGTIDRPVRAASSRSSPAPW